jgi:N utilization substance protein A
LNSEKIDVVQWSEDPRLFIASALSPAQVQGVTLNQPENTAQVRVPDKHLSLAIGKEGQNVRLAAKLTGWRIDIKSISEFEAEKAAHKAEVAEVKRKAGIADEVIPEEGLAPVTLPEEITEADEAAEPVTAAAEVQTAAEIEILIPVETAPAQPSKIRFAEEIMAGRAGKSKQKETKKDADGKEAGAKIKKAKQKKATYIVDEDFEE